MVGAIRPANAASATPYQKAPRQQGYQLTHFLGAPMASPVTPTQKQQAATAPRAAEPATPATDGRRGRDPQARSAEDAPRRVVFKPRGAALFYAAGV